MMCDVVRTAVEGTTTDVEHVTLPRRRWIAGQSVPPPEPRVEWITTPPVLPSVSRQSVSTSCGSVPFG